jgi:hypothetical protein
MPPDAGPPAVVAIGGGRLVSQEDFERTAESVGRARLHIEDVLTEHGVDDRDVVDAAVLLISELGTDALQHGRGPAFTVAVTLSGISVQVSVQTAVLTARAVPAHRDGPSSAPRRGAAGAGNGADPDIAPHSRTIVEMMADSWDLRQTPTERTAWFRLDR